MIKTLEHIQMLRGIEYMENSDNLWEYTHLVIGLGLPTTAPDEQIASVYREQESKKFRLALNAHKLKKFSDEQVAAVLFHESLHILFNHLYKKFSWAVYHKELIIAEEIQINDVIEQIGINLPEGVILGKEQLGYNTAEKNMSLKEIYDELIKKRDKKKDKKDKGDSGSGGEPKGKKSDEGDSDNGNGGEPKGKKGSKGSPIEIKGNHPVELSDSSTTISSHGKTPDLTVIKESDITPYMADPTSIMQLAGGADSTTERVIEYAEKHKITPLWVQTLLNLNPSMANEVGLTYARPEKDWTRSKRSMEAYRNNGAVIIPRIKSSRTGGYKRKTKKHKIVFFVDQSGSIPSTIAKKALALAESTNGEMFECEVMVFAGRTSPYSVGNRRYTIGYGTEFLPIIEDVRKLDANTAIVILTDNIFNTTSRQQSPFNPDKTLFVDLASNHYEFFWERGKEITKFFPKLPSVVRFKDII